MLVCFGGVALDAFCRLATQRYDDGCHRGNLRFFHVLDFLLVSLDLLGAAKVYQHVWVRGVLADFKAGSDPQVFFSLA